MFLNSAILANPDDAQFSAQQGHIVKLFRASGDQPARASVRLFQEAWASAQRPVCERLVPFGPNYKEGRQSLTRILLLLLAAMLVLPAVSFAQLADPDPPKFRFEGVLKCADCHLQPSPIRIRATHTDWVELNEYTKWDQSDKHQTAFIVLKGQRAEQIGRRLGWQPGEVSRRQDCLSCHANWHKRTPRLEAFNVEQGVSCESCHGPASAYLRPHEEKSWRLKSAEEKAALGMVEVREPRRRARQCLSCHLGNTDQGKVLTHEMYAAGHPPLPAIEIETFAQNMPPHWRTLEQKPDNLPNLDSIRTLLRQPAGELHGFKSVLVGGVMTLREQVYFLATEAAADGKGHTWPEFAQFDCSSCHHELESPSWRQVRRQGRRPGRPPLPRWPSMLVELAVRHVAGGDEETAKRMSGELSGRLQRLNTIFDATPFGNPTALGNPAETDSVSGSLVSWLDNLADMLARARYDRPAARSTLSDMVALAAAKPLDFDSARHLTWALDTIHAQLAPRKGRSTELQAIYGQLAEQLNLRLPAGKERQIEDNLPALYHAAGQHTPARYRTLMGRLQQHLTE